MGNKNMKLLQTVLGVLGGNAILAFSVAAFIVPHGIIMGGATGIGLLLSRVISLPLSSLILAVNAFLFVWGDAGAGEEVCSDNDSQVPLLIRHFCLWHR